MGNKENSKRPKQLRNPETMLKHFGFIVKQSTSINTTKNIVICFEKQNNSYCFKHELIIMLFWELRKQSGSQKSGKLISRSQKSITLINMPINRMRKRKSIAKSLRLPKKHMKFLVTMTREKCLTLGG